MKDMIYTDPIAKHYYTLFTKGKKAEILANIKDFYGVYRHIMDYIVPITDKYGGTVTATLVSAVVDEDGTGYGVLNVLGYVDGDNVPFDCLTDIAWIEKGIVHTWFPYPKVAFYDKNNAVRVATISSMNNYMVKERAMKYIRQTSMEEKLHASIQKGIMNGVYENDYLIEAMQAIAKPVEVIDKSNKEDTGVMSLADMMDEWGMDPKEPLEELEEYQQSRKELLHSEMALLFEPESKEEVDEVKKEETKEIELEDIIEAEYTELD